MTSSLETTSYPRWRPWACNSKRPPHSASIIVFSKDRPLQLSALLKSIDHYCTGFGKISVLYSASTPSYQDAYERLSSEMPEKSFVHEESFRSDLIRLISQSTETFLFFLVDDIIFMNYLDASILARGKKERHILSLRLHPGITYSYMTHKNQQPPAFEKRRDGLLEFSWLNNAIDWSYPLSVDGHVFERKFILKLIRKCSFKAPNSLEAELQRFTPKAAARYTGLCFEAPRIVNFPVNKVQNEFANRSGEQSTEDLLQAFNQGLEIDFLKYHKRVYNSVHVEEELVLKQRDV